MSSRAHSAGHPPAIALLGPTGSGKSAFAMRLAAGLPVEIVSVDSAQVYRGLDIGTAKPTREERARVPHHLIDILEPEEVYSAGRFRSDVEPLLPQIRARGRIPLLVGGTMLYYRALFRGLAGLPTADPAVRAALDERALREGWPALHAELARLDPAGAARIHPHDAQRIQRALEVLNLSGRALTDHWRQQPPPEDFAQWRCVILEPQRREQLHAQLKVRLQAMLAQGFVAEVRTLLARGTLTRDSPVLRLVGYRQLAAHCLGEMSLEAAAAQALAATRQLAKRQLTWLRSATVLPDTAIPERIDAQDDEAREQLALALIQSVLPP
ncbi:MAG: tRNA (adenosine(37)-N6)-dimethylallyltransferase MiaA [Steroidobacteraceae bacterium]